MNPYLGSITETETPRCAKAWGSDPSTSPNPPTFANGAHSAAAMSTDSALRGIGLEEFYFFVDAIRQRCVLVVVFDDSVAWQIAVIITASGNDEAIPLGDVLVVRGLVPIVVRGEA